MYSVQPHQILAATSCHGRMIHTCDHADARGALEWSRSDGGEQKAGEAPLTSNTDADRSHFPESLAGTGAGGRSQDSHCGLWGVAVPPVRDQPRDRAKWIQGVSGRRQSKQLWGYGGLIHRPGPTLARPQSTAAIINTVAGQPPLCAQRPGHRKTHDSRSPSAKPPPRPPEDVSPSGCASVDCHVRRDQQRAGRPPAA